MSGIVNTIGAKSKIIEGKKGIGTATAGAKLHVFSGESNRTPDATADDLFIEGAAVDTGMTIATGNDNNDAAIMFANSNAAHDGRIIYDNNARELQFYAAGGKKMTLWQRSQGPGCALGSHDGEWPLDLRSYMVTSNWDTQVAFNMENTRGGGGDVYIRAKCALNNRVGYLKFSSGGEWYAYDYELNESPISPHNFDNIPSGPSEDLAWSFTSNKCLSKDENGAIIEKKFIGCDMTKIIREVEALTGTKHIYKGLSTLTGTLDEGESGFTSVDDGSTVGTGKIAELEARILALESAISSLQ